MKLFSQMIFSLTLMLFGVSSFLSSQVADGSAAPGFKLKDSANKERSLAEFKGKWVVLEWYNQGCPFVKKHYDSGNMQGLQKEFTAKGVIWLSIISSAEGKEGFCTAEETKALQTEGKNLASAILRDEKGEVGKLYNAKTTPYMVIVNPKGDVVYTGAIDNKPSANPNTLAGAVNYVSENLKAALAGKALPHPSNKSYGCSVKY